MILSQFFTEFYGAVKKLDAAQSKSIHLNQKDNSMKTEKCVLCGRDTGIETETPVSHRKNYIIGGGQLCEKCYSDIYTASDSQDITPPKKKPKSPKKALKTASYVFYVLFITFSCLLAILTVISLVTFNSTDRNLFGYKFYIALSDSMSETDFEAGDLIIVKNTDPSNLREGDIITYISQNPENFGKPVTHKIRTLTTDENGNPGFITFGTVTDTDDAYVVTYRYVLGKYEGHISNIGSLFNFLKSTAGYVTCILIPLLLIIIFESIRYFLLCKKVRDEQLKEIQAERKMLEEERIKMQKTIQESKNNTDYK